MPDLFFDPRSGELDYMLGILLFSILSVLAALLLPVPPAKKKPTPSEDTTKTRKVR